MQMLLLFSETYLDNLFNGDINHAGGVGQVPEISLSKIGRKKKTMREDISFLGTLQSYIIKIPSLSINLRFSNVTNCSFFSMLSIFMF